MRALVWVTWRRASKERMHRPCAPPGARAILAGRISQRSQAEPAAPPAGRARRPPARWSALRRSGHRFGAREREKTVPQSTMRKSGIRFSEIIVRPKRDRACCRFREKAACSIRAPAGWRRRDPGDRGSTSTVARQAGRPERSEAGQRLDQDGGTCTFDGNDVGAPALSAVICLKPVQFQAGPWHVHCEAARAADSGRGIAR